MLRLYDSGQRDVVPVEPVRRGQLLLDICGPSLAQPAHVGDLRPVLLADLIRRTAERRRLAVLASLSRAGDTGRQDGGDERQRAFRDDCAALGIRPPEFASRHELGNLIDIRVGPAQPGEAAGRAQPGDSAGRAQPGEGPGPAAGETPGPAQPGESPGPAAGEAAGHPVVRRRAESGPVLFEGREPAVILADLGRRGLDPLALRLALLNRGYREPADLSWPELAAADAELRRWRGRVAEWATQPSRPLSGEHAGRVIAAFEDDLTTRAALDALRALDGDASIPAGAKFETFAHVDQLLGLDLASEIGRVPAAPPATR